MTNHSSPLVGPLELARWLLLVTLVSLAGCKGCRSGTDPLSKEEIEKRAKEQRESLEMSELLALPIDSESSVLTAKPGHWYETQQQFKSNREDLQVVAVGSVARGTELAHIPGTNIQNEFTRRTSLPKGQTKTVDLQYFVPFSAAREATDSFSGKSTLLQFRTELFSWPLMTPILQGPNTKFVNELKPHEFQLVVLSPQALSYEYLSVLDAVYWRGDELMMVDERTRSYHVSLLKPENNRYAMPRSMLTLTATAVILWDDVSVDDLSNEQQNALVDWIHWGGQLIVSGPSSWSRLQNSFLTPHLPATTAEATEFSTDAFAEMSRTWVVEDRTAPGSLEGMEIVGPPIGGLRFQLNDQGSWLPGSGELVAERQVGRGRVVLTGFPMREPRLYRWKYFSSFFSTGLLRRIPRTVDRRKSDRLISQVWAAPFTGSEHDARLHSNFRILSRDLPLSHSAVQTIGADNLDQLGTAAAGALAAAEFNTPTPDAPHESYEPLRWGGGGGLWNDYSGLSYQAITSLRAAAGIELPSRRTILYLLAGYLACLVPINWLVFRLIGRLEYAWLAAPIMAIVGVIVVTKVARLDIGFARRTTEISVLEIQGEHTRAHLTQYIALYTSLSTNYALDFPENGSVALPLGDVARVQRRAGALTRNMRTNYGRSEGVTLEPLTVYSNSTEMIHSEQMIDLAGGLLLGRREAGPPAIKNETGVSLKSAMVVRRSQAGPIEVAWVGDLTSGQAASLNFESVDRDSLWRNWAMNPVTQATMPDEHDLAEAAESALWIGGVMQEIVRKTPLLPGQTRLVGYTDDATGNLNVSPKEDQYDGRCVVVAHLSPQQLLPITPDLAIMSRSATGATNPDEVPESLRPQVTPVEGEP